MEKSSFVEARHNPAGQSDRGRAAGTGRRRM